jgi:hypothetical protein
MQPYYYASTIGIFNQFLGGLINPVLHLIKVLNPLLSICQKNKE